MSFWNDLKAMFFGEPLKAQFIELLEKEEAQPEPVKEEPMAAKKKPAAKPADKGQKKATPAAKPAAKPKKKK